MIKVVGLFLSLLFVRTAFADVSALQCRTDDIKITFSCGDWSYNTSDGINDEAFIFAPCVAPTGYAFGGWKVENMPVVLNVATVIPYLMGSADIQYAPIFDDIELAANWIPLVDIDNFSVKETVVGLLYNPEINRVYYEFPSGGIVVKPVCSSEEVGDGTATLSVAGEVGTLPTASSAVDLSNPGDVCWIGIDAPNGDGMKYVAIGADSDCQNSCAGLPLMLALMRYQEPEYASLYDAVISQMLTVMLGK